MIEVSLSWSVPSPRQPAVAKALKLAALAVAGSA